MKNKLSIIAYSGELDKLLSVFILATGAAASGMEVSIFTTFWATAVLRKERGKSLAKKTFLEKVFGWLLPKGPRKLRLSQMDFCGMGRAAMKKMMLDKNVASLEELMKTAEELGVRVNICEMSMDMMGITRNEIIDYKGLQYYGVAGFLNDAKDGMTLFI